MVWIRLGIQIVEIAEEKIEEKAFAFSKLARYANNADLQTQNALQDNNGRKMLTFLSAYFGFFNILSSASTLSRNV